MKPPATKARQRSSPNKDERDQAEAIAIEALAFLAGDPDRLGTFLALSGLGPKSLRDASREPHFLAGVLDHVVSDERLLLDFAEHLDADPFEVTRARVTLGGMPRDAP